MIKIMVQTLYYTSVMMYNEENFEGEYCLI